MSTSISTTRASMPCRPNDVAPDLSLFYHTGMGNGPFGMGFGLSTLMISRSTDHRMPSYEKGKDIFTLVGSGELVVKDGLLFGLD